MEFIDVIQDYKAYRNKDGTIDLYKTIGKIDHNKQQSGSNMNVIHTPCKTMAEVERLLKKKVILKPKEDKSNDLFPND